MVRKMSEAETIAGQIGNNDDLFDLMIRMGRPIEGGSDDAADEDLFAAMVSKPEGKNLVGRAVDGVVGGLTRIGKLLYDNSSLLQLVDSARSPKRSPKAAELPAFAPAAPREAKPADAGVTPLTTEELRQRSENSWLRKNLREGLAEARKVDKAALLLAGVDIATLAAGIGIAYYGTGSGTEAMLGMELKGLALAAVGQLGIIVSMRSERAIEGIPEAESRYARVVQSLQRGCANYAVLGAFRLARNLGVGVMGGSAFHYAFEILSAGQQAAAGAPAPAEVVQNVGGNVVPGQITPDQMGGQIAQGAAQKAAEQLGQTSAGDLMNQADTMIGQLDNVLPTLSSDLSSNPQLKPLIDAANQARQDAVFYYNQALTSGGGFDTAEVAHLKELASQAQQAANQALEAARLAAQQNAQTAAGAADAEAIRQGILHSGQVMEKVIVATPSGTPFEALQQVVWKTTHSPFSAEIANTLSWVLPVGDITGLHSGAIEEGAKTVAGLLQQAHDFAATHGGEYTVHAIRQAVTDGRLSQDVLRAVEAANLPAGEGKNQAIQALNTVLQGVIK